MSKVPRNQRSSVKDTIGEFVVAEILRSVSSGTSPVQGESFKKLKPEYADKHKGGNRTPNLDLEGDMLDSLTFKKTSSGIDVGIFKASEVPKADGHNDFSGLSELPRRRFIPEDEQEFKSRINSGINKIIKANEDREEGEAPVQFDPVIELTKGGVGAAPSNTIGITLSSLFDDDDLLGGLF